MDQGAITFSSVLIKSNQRPLIGTPRADHPELRRWALSGCGRGELKIASREVPKVAVSVIWQRRAAQRESPPMKTDADDYGWHGGDNHG